MKCLNGIFFVAKRMKMFGICNNSNEQINNRHWLKAECGIYSLCTFSCLWYEQKNHQNKTCSYNQIKNNKIILTSQRNATQLVYCSHAHLNACILNKNLFFAVKLILIAIDIFCFLIKLWILIAHALPHFLVYFFLIESCFARIFSANKSLNNVAHSENESQ